MCISTKLITTLITASGVIISSSMLLGTALAADKSKNSIKGKAARIIESHPNAGQVITNLYANQFKVRQYIDYGKAARDSVAAAAAFSGGPMGVVPGLVLGGSAAYNLSKAKKKQQQYVSACEWVEYSNRVKKNRQCLPYPGMPQ